MFSEVSEECIKQAIHAEKEEAKVQYGEKYNSLHEGYAVLKEEVEEVRDENIHIRNELFDTWTAIKGNWNVENHVKSIREHAEKLALEAVQVCAVCEKILKSI